MLLTIKEAAQLLRVSVSTIYRWIHQKKIEHIKIGSRVLFSKEILDKFIKDNIVAPE